MVMRYIKTGEDEDGNPIYDYVDDGVDDSNDVGGNGNGDGFGGFGDNVDLRNFTSTNPNIFGGGFGEAHDVDPSRYTVVGTDEDGQPIVVERDPGVITGPGSVPGSNGAVGAGSSGTAANPGGSAPKPGGTTPKPKPKPSGGLGNLLSGDNSLGNILGLLIALKAMNSRGGNTNKTTPINPNKYTFNQKPIEQPVYTPYSGSSSPVMGRKHFEDPTYTVKAAVGGIMGLAHGGAAKHPRYLQGATDGMADKLSTSIDGEHPAALSHGEFVIPADVVSHLGNGNSEAGANQLYKMMDRIRVARTGTKQQGKRINPEKFTPGGIAGYAGGGVIAFDAGGTTTVESNLASWAAPGITDMVERGTALAKQPYQAYTGPLVAGTSPLQQKAFTAAGNLTTPAALGQAATMAATAGNKMGDQNYTTTKVGSTYVAPDAYKAGSIGNTYTDTGAYNAGTLTNQYKATGEYKPTDFKNQYSNTLADFDADAIRKYMDPNLRTSLDPQIAELRRQYDIQNASNLRKLASQGALGGSRQAMMEAELQRNLQSKIADVTGAGYNTAFTNAQKMFTDRQTEARLNAENTAKYGADAAKDMEASRQFAKNKAIDEALNTAKYGESAFTNTAAERQFAANKAISNAENRAKYGLEGFKATEDSRYNAAKNAADIASAKALYDSKAQDTSVMQNKYAGDYGLTSLRDQANAANILAGIGNTQNAAGIANLNAQAAQGATQRDIEQQGIDALYKQYEQAKLDPYTKLEFEKNLYKGLPINTQTSGYSQSDLDRIMTAIGLGTATRDTVNGTSTPG